jgi:protein involved in polysaccharide export with SLBB domain
LIKGVTYLCLAAILILLQASAASAQEPAKVIQPANDAGAAGRASGMSPKASSHTPNASTAKPLRLPIPVYPRLAVKYRITGIVKVAVEIDSKGIITSANAQDGPMMLRRSALDAAYLAHFSPAQVGGQPAKSNGVINYIFRLDDHKTEEVNAVSLKPDPTAFFANMPPVESGKPAVDSSKPPAESAGSKVPETVNPNGAITEKVGTIPVKTDPIATATVMPVRDGGESTVPSTVILKGDLKEKVNAVKLDPTNSGTDKLPGESRKSSLHDIVHLKGAIAEKVSAAPVKSDPAALVTNKPAVESSKPPVESGKSPIETGKPAVESGESKVPATLNAKGDQIEKVGAAPVKPNPAASVANMTPVGSSKSPLETGKAPLDSGKPAVESSKPPVEIAGSKVPDGVIPNGEKNATAVITASQPVVTPLSPTTTYRVGVGDILDVRILGDTSKKSTLVSVLEGGVLDYHVAGDPVVGGMTLEEIRTILTTELKRRSSDPDLRLAVGVRDYASHTVTVSGLVAVPGNKILRREAIPLYVALAEAQPRPEADRVQISCRATGQITLLSLNDPLAMETLVHPGDVINVSPRPSEFYYIAGYVNVPGQKSLPLGITLMQAIMSAGGVSRPNVERVEIGRQRPDGFVSFEKYDLKEIKAGNMKDPTLRAGDRIEVLKP